MSKKKILSILIITILFCVCLLNSRVFATGIVTIDAGNTSATPANLTGTTPSSITITSQSGKNNTVNNLAINNLTQIGNNSVKNNVSSYNNIANKANNTAGLPYTGSGSSMIFIVVALAISAVYAYKKVRDYNI